MKKLLSIVLIMCLLLSMGMVAMGTETDGSIRCHTTVTVNKTFERACCGSIPRSVIFRLAGNGYDRTATAEITDGRGTATFGCVPWDSDLTLTEETISDCWNSDTPMKVEVEKCSVTVDLTNTFNYGELEVQKVFEPSCVDKPKYVEFTLTGEGHEAHRTATAGDWNVTFDELCPGTYTLTEEISDGCWKPIRPIEVPIGCGDRERIVVTNTAIEGIVVVHKSFEGECMTTPESVYFVLDGTTKAASDRNGWTVTYSGLCPGIYDLEEEDLGGHWISDAPKTVTVPPLGGTVHVDVTNTYRTCPGTVVVYKSFDKPDDVTTPRFAEFTLVGEDYEMTQKAYRPDWTATFDGLCPGDYILTETGLDGWTSSGLPPWRFTVGPGMTTEIAVVNEYEPDLGHVRINKRFVGGTMPSGTALDFYLMSYPQEEIVASMTAYVNADGMSLGPAGFRHVEPGMYTIREDLGGISGWTYSLSEMPFEVVGGKIEDVHVTNTYTETTGSVVFVKEWIWDGYDGDPITTVTALWGEGQTLVEITSPSWMTEPIPQPTGTYEVDEEDLGLGWLEPEFYTAPAYDADRDPVTEGVAVEEGKTVYVFIVNEYEEPPVTTPEVYFIKEWPGGIAPGVTSVTAFWKAVEESEYVEIDITSENSWVAGPVPQPPGDYNVMEGKAVPLDWESSLYWSYTEEGERKPVAEDTVTVMEGKNLWIFMENKETTTTPGVHFVKEWPDGMAPEGVTSVTALWKAISAEEYVELDITSGNSWMAGPVPQPPGEYNVMEGDVPEGWVSRLYWSHTEEGTRTPVTDGMVAVTEGKDLWIFIVNEMGVEVEKTVNPALHYTGGGPATYTVTFTNNSETTFDAFYVQDYAEWFVLENASEFESDMDGNPITTSPVAFFSGGPHEIPFGPGSVVTATWKYDSSGLSVGSYENMVTGTAYMEVCDDIQKAPEPNGNGECTLAAVVWDTDDATLAINRRPSRSDDDDPRVRIEKSVDPTSAEVGDTVIYTIKVTNNGDVSLRDVMVIDDMINVEWDIGDLSKGDSITETFNYTIKAGDFENGVFENTAEVTADSREGKASDTDDATVRESGETIIVPPGTTPENPPEVVVPPVVPPQAEETTLPQTGQSGVGILYGIGSAVLAAGYIISRRRRSR